VKSLFSRRRIMVIYLKKEVEDETRYSILFSYKKTLIKKGTVILFVRVYEIHKSIYKKLSDKFLMGLKADNMTFIDFSSKPEDIVLSIGEDPKTIIKYYTTNESERTTFIL
jgi:hypothetical protein